MLQIPTQQKINAMLTTIDLLTEKVNSCIAKFEKEQATPFSNHVAEYYLRKETNYRDTRAVVNRTCSALRMKQMIASSFALTEVERETARVIQHAKA